MFKVFFATFFIAELIIALAVILRIYKLNKYVNSLNDSVLLFQNKIKTGFVETRLFFKEFNESILKLKEFILEKQEEYIIKITKKLLIYSCLLFLRGKCRNTLLAYHIGREIYEGINEA